MILFRYLVGLAKFQPCFVTILKLWKLKSIVFSFWWSVWARAVPRVGLSHETTKDCAAYFCQEKSFLLAQVISLDSFFLFCPPRFYMLFWLDLISIVSFRILRWEMRPIQPLRTYIQCLRSSGKTSNGMLHNCNIFVKIHGAGTRLFTLNPTLIYRFLVKSFSKGFLCYNTL